MKQPCLGKGGVSFSPASLDKGEVSFSPASLAKGGVCFLPEPLAKGGVIFGGLRGVKMFQAGCLGRLRI